MLDNTVVIHRHGKNAKHYKKSDTKELDPTHGCERGLREWYDLILSRIRQSVNKNGTSAKKEYNRPDTEP